MAPNRLLQLHSSLSRFMAKGGRGLWSGFERKQEPKQFRDVLTLSLNRQVRQTLSAYTVARLVTETEKAQTVTSRLQRILRETFRPLTSFMATSEVSKYLKWSANQGGQSALSLMGVRATFDIRDGKFLSTLEKRGAWLLKNVDDTTLGALQDKVVAAVKDGLTATEIQNSITAEFEDEISPYRAEMITRTEFANAATNAQRKTFKESGIEKWTWSQPPGDEDDDCTENDGETVTMGEPFPTGDDQPPLHPNCKCAVIPVPPEDFDPEGAWLGD